MNMLKRNEQNEKEINHNWSVYIHINKINNKKYVGITSREPSLRWQNGTAYARNPHFNAAIQKYGWDNFEHIILHKNLSYSEACSYEKKYIRELSLKDSDYGYNMTDGGEGMSGYKFSKEQIEECKKRNRGKNNPCYGRVGSKHPMYGIKGINNPNYGRKATLEQREHISAGRKGIIFSAEHIKHMKDSAKRGKEHFRSTAVNMFDTNGTLIKSFETASDGAKFVGADVSNIVKCCKGKIHTSMGYIWRYVKQINK